LRCGNALIALEVREALCGAEFPGFGLLVTCDRKGAFEITFGSIPLWRYNRDFFRCAMDLHLVPSLPSCFD
jgi:hypothetical protein